MTSTHRFLLVLPLAAMSWMATGCRRRTPAPVPAPPAVGTDPRPAGGGQAPIVIQPGGGLGGTQVLSNGRAAWPPQGPGCDVFVNCCQQAAAQAGDVSLFCQMSVAQPPVDCARALGQVRSYLAEQNVVLPPACR